MPTPLPTLLTELALRSRVATKVVTSRGSWFWHGRVNLVGNQVADELADQVGNVARVPVGDRFASAAEANFGINFALNRLFNIVGGR